MNLTFREAMLTFKRAPLLSALSVTTIAFSLFVLGLFGLVVINLQDALHRVEERVEVVAYLLPGAPIEATAQALKDIEAFPEVQSANYVSEDDALARARAELVELRDVMQELERNPLPASIEVKLKPGFRDTDHVSGVADRLRGFGFVDDVRFGRDWVEKLDRLRGLAIMRLVGATDWFIRRPFLLQGTIKGLLGGGVAIALSFAAYVLINKYLLQSAFFTQEQAAAIVGFGALIGLIGSAMSVGRHLKRV